MNKMHVQQKLDIIFESLAKTKETGFPTYWSERLSTPEGEEEFSALLEIINPSVKGTPYIPDPNEKPMSRADKELLDAINNTTWDEGGTT
jgi:hypothetical protein